MKEVKEILDNLKKTADTHIFVVCGSQEELDKAPKYTANFLSINDRQAKVLLDYITTLQKENEQLHSIIKEVREYIMTELIDEWDIKNGGNVSGSDLPVYAITPILEILDKGE